LIGASEGSRVSSGAYLTAVPVWEGRFVREARRKVTVIASMRDMSRYEGGRTSVVVSSFANFGQ
jgi:hypothetical protein